jgi:hypothetical protein
LPTHPAVILNASIKIYRYSCLVARQHKAHLDSCGANHSIETAVLKVLSDILLAIDNGDLSVLVLLDLSAAFDMVDHNILLRRLDITYRLDGTVLN